MRVRAGSVPFLVAALVGATIGALLAFVPAANAWVPIWASALDPEVSAAPAAELYRMAADGSGQTRLTIWWPGEPWDISGLGYPPETVALLLLTTAGIGFVSGWLTDPSETAAAGDDVSIA